MRQSGQIMRFSDVELSLMKGAFAENEDFLFLIRKFLLQGEITREEQDRLNALSEETYNLLRKMFLPEIDTDAPLFQITDMVKGLEPDLRSKNADEMRPYLRAKKLEIDYLTQRFDVLKGVIVSNEIKLKSMGVIPAYIEAQAYDILVQVIAHNWLLDYVDSRCRELSFLAGLKTETVEDTVKRLQQNSNK